MGRDNTSSKATMSKLIRGSIWLYTTSIANNLLGFIYWFTLSRLANPDLIGYVSSVLGLSGIVVGLASLGVDVGIRKKVAECVGVGEKRRASTYFTSALIFWLTIYTILAATLVLSANTLALLTRFEPAQIVVASIFVFLGFTQLFSALLTALLRTDLLLLGSLIGNVAKLVVGVGSILLGFGWVGAALAYTCTSFAILAICAAYVRKTIGFHPAFKLDYVSQLIRIGFTSWAPATIMVLGQWLGVLMVFGTSSAFEAGKYYISLTIVGFLTGFGTSIATLLLPAVSMDSRLKEVSTTALKIASLIVTPPVVFSIFYAEHILSLLNPAYTAAENTFRVLALSWIPAILNAGIASMLYVENAYTQVLLLGVAQSIPRITLYLALTPLLGDFGTAIAYTVGSYTGLAYTIHAARRRKIDLKVGAVLAATAIATLVVAPVQLLNIPPFPALLLTLTSYPIYTRLKLMQRAEVRLILESIVGRNLVAQIYSKLKPVVDVMVPE